MKIKKLMLFGYHFPHKKTQDFLFRLLVEGYQIEYVLAAPWQKLNLSPANIRIAPENVGLIHPQKICQRFGINYLVFEHNSQEAIDYLQKHQVDLGIISGARILSKAVIKAAKNKILNIHPGLLPEVRGLDTLLWSIHKNRPLGISAHLLGARIDSGRLIYKEKLRLKKDDTVIDASLRLLEKQTDILVKSLQVLAKKRLDQLKNLNLQNNPYYSKMSRQMEGKTIKKFSSWLKNHS